MTPSSSSCVATAPPAGIADLIPRLQRLDAIFAQETVFDPATLQFVQANLALFGIGNFDRLGVPDLARIERFRTIRAPWLGQDGHVPDIGALLLAFDPATRFSAADQPDLAAVLGCDIGPAQSLHANLNLAATPFEVLEELLGAVALAQHVGVGGAALALAQSHRYDDLAAASAAVQAAFRAKYEDEAEWERNRRTVPRRPAFASARRPGRLPRLTPGRGVRRGLGPLPLLPARRGGRRLHADLAGRRGHRQRSALRAPLPDEPRGDSARPRRSGPRPS